MCLLRCWLRSLFWVFLMARGIVVVLLLHWREAATGSRASGEKGMHPLTDCQILTGYHPGRRVASKAATGI